jgi:CDP-diacylglycerol--serine O-phosphatidyltransferase
MTDPVAAEPPVLRIAIPAAVTLAGLFCGLLSMSWATTRPYAACLAILGAGMFDMVDGRVARMVNGRSTFGAELDSLADIVSFGVAPAWLAYCWALAEPTPAGTVPGVDPWLFFAFAFTACSAVRLARFNVEDGADDALTERFGGLPTPAGALLIVTVVMASHELGMDELRSRAVVAPLLLISGALMVSRIPLRSYKKFPNRFIQVSYWGLIVFGLALLLLDLPGGTVLFGFVVYYILRGITTGLGERREARGKS